MRRRPEFRQLLMGMSISRYLPRDGDRGLRALQREREQARAPPAAEDDAEDVVHEGVSGVTRTF